MLMKQMQGSTTIQQREHLNKNREMRLAIKLNYMLKYLLPRESGRVPC